MQPRSASPLRKQTIPAALREQVWIVHMGKVFEGKCRVRWCSNTISVFDFQSGHNIPESRGGSTDLSNLVPICARCNQSMGDRFTIDQWNRLSEPKGFRRFFRCFGVSAPAQVPPQTEWAPRSPRGRRPPRATGIPQTVQSSNTDSVSDSW
jgi:5-methylcytosine-specific restriction endonuclease McrA